MWIEQRLWTPVRGWETTRSREGDLEPRVVFFFAAPGQSGSAERFDEIRRDYPSAIIAGCSTGGEIHGLDVYDDSVSVTALGFRHGRVEAARIEVGSADRSREAGRELAALLPRDGLRGLFVLSDGTQVNGSELVDGLRSALGDGVILTGGLAGDGADFKSTRVGLNAPPTPGQVVGIGFYGERTKIRHGSFGGWDTFGPERRITRSVGNVLHELDGEPALDLYIRYLGEEAEGLPGSALLYPLFVRADEADQGAVVRTVVGIDREARTMTFAGDVPQGALAQLMRGNFDGLVDGAAQAAQQAQGGSGSLAAILVSCIGRKLLLGQRIPEEVEAVAEILGPDCALTGFYSYGEISPHGVTGRCELHNQTMTITVIGED